MKQRPEWYVLTGGPSVGKTTLLDELNDLGFRTQPEAARAVIDKHLQKNISVDRLRKNEKVFQELVMKQKIDDIHNLETTETIFFDRGMQDTLAYLRYYKYNVEKWIREACKIRYSTVFILEGIDFFKHDYARTEDYNFSTKIEQLLISEYKKDHNTVVKVPKMPVTERAQFIIDYIRGKN